MYLHRIVAMFVVMCLSFSVQAASVWFADDQYAYQVDTDTNIVTRSFLLNKAHDLAVDGSNLWSATGQQLSKYNSSGAPLFQISLQALNLVPPLHLVADPYNGSVWVTDSIVLGHQNKLAHLTKLGQLLGEWPISTRIWDSALSLDQSLWLLSKKRLNHYDAQGTLLASYNLGAPVRDDPKFIAIDSIAKRLWVASETQLLQYDLANPTLPLLNIALPAVISGITIIPGSGTLWALAEKNLRGYARDGVLVNTVNLKALGIANPRRLVYEPASLSLWLGHETGLSRLSADGTVIITLPAATPVQAIGTSPFVVTPTLTLIQPPQDAYLNNPKPTFTLGYDAQCANQPCGFDPAYYSSYSLTALLNNNAVGNLFVFDPVTGHTNYTPTNVLPEGVTPFTAQASDSFGHVTNSIDTVVTIDTIAPSFVGISPRDGSVIATKQVNIEVTIDDATASVMLESAGAVTGNSASGSYPTFSFPVTLNPGLNTYTLTAYDRAGNSTSQTLHLSFNPVSVAITTPIAGATIAGDNALVSGTYQGPVNTGINVNGIVASQVGDRFYAEVPLNPGANTLTATATTPEGMTAIQTVSVNRNGTAPIQVKVEPMSGIAPLKTNFTVSISTAAVTLRSIQIDFDGDGNIDYNSADPSVPASFTYATPGVYQANITVTDSLNNAFTQVVLVSVQDGVQMDQLFTTLLGGMNTALISGDVTKAGSFLNTAAKQKYLPVFQTLLAQMPQIIASYSPLRRVSITGEIGEYAINRTIGGRNKLFLIYFLKDSDGVWRLDAM